MSETATFQTKDPLAAALLASSKRSRKATSEAGAYTVVLSGLFGRRRMNRLKEVGCTISHLFAMQRAAEDYRANNDPNKSKYALIVEDDVQVLYFKHWLFEE